MTFLETLGLDVTKEIAKHLVNRAFQNRGSKAHDDIAIFEARIAEHLTLVDNITTRVEFFGLGAAKRTDRDTIDLFATLPRKFARGSRTQLTERHLLFATGHYVLLGTPGAGKTTTLKRLARRLLVPALYAPTPADEGVSAQYPIFVRLRELTSGRDIIEVLGSLFGLVDNAALWQFREGENEEEHRRRRLRAVASIADATRPIMLLDGLDEVEPSIRSSTEASIVAIAESCHDARIIVTCRSGDYNAQLAQFDVLELAPLTDRQIKDIAKRWTDNWKLFLSALNSQPFVDLASRPLFLCQLLVVFDQDGSIPDRPSDVIARIIKLSLEEWDENHKRQPRRSQYATLDVARKRDFLATLAFLFLYKLPNERLTTGLLEAAYMEVYERFGLPRADAARVARELETHTGIFVEVGREFEFSHLSIQEYLAATYLSRQPVGPEYGMYLRVRPAPLAVAVALSTKPELWMAELLLRDSCILSVGINTLRSFFARLLLERPALIRNVNMGVVAISLVATLAFRDEYVRRFLELPAVRSSIEAAVPFYRVTERRGRYHLELSDAVLPQMHVGPRLLDLSADNIREITAQGFLDDLLQEFIS